MRGDHSIRTVILGAGVSGLSAGLALTKNQDQDYSIYEQSSVAGGLCQSTQMAGFMVEKVTHVLHFRSSEAQGVVKELLDGQLNQIERSAWIHYARTYVPYPFQTHLGFLPLAQKVDCLAQFCRPWFSRKMKETVSDQNFENWIHAHFGRGIAKHFMVPYNTKLWGVPPSDMSTDWVKQFVPNTSMRRVLAGFFSHKTNEVGYNSSFLYPRTGGIRSLVDAMEARVRPVFYQKKVVQIDLHNKTVSFEDGEIVAYDRLISSIPLTNLIKKAKGVPDDLRVEAEYLRSTSLLNITYCLGRRLTHSYHWAYFPEPQYPFFRLVFPSNISSSLAPSGSSIISAEISNPDMKHEAELEDQVKGILLDLKFIDRPSDIVFAVRTFVEYAYPVHDLGRETRVAKLQDFLQSKGVWSIGRFGSWRYSSLGEAISQAFETVREL